MQAISRAHIPFTAALFLLGACVSMPDEELALDARIEPRIVAEPVPTTRTAPLVGYDVRTSIVDRTEVRWPRGDRLEGRVETSFEEGELFVWGTIEAPHLRRGQVIGYATIQIVDGAGDVWRSSRSTYREPVKSDPPSAAAVFCMKLSEQPPDGWHVVVTHHPMVFDPH